MKKRFSEEQIIGFLHEADAGLPIKALCRRHAFSEASDYLWRSKFGGMNVSEAKRRRELETENTRLKRLLAKSLLEIEITREVLRKSTERAGATCLAARDSIPRPQRAARVTHAAHERQCAALCAGAGSQRGVA